MSPACHCPLPPSPPAPLGPESAHQEKAATTVRTAPVTGTEAKGLEDNTVEKLCILFTVISVLLSVQRDTCIMQSPIS